MFTSKIKTINAPENITKVFVRVEGESRGNNGRERYIIAVFKIHTSQNYSKEARE